MRQKRSFLIIAVVFIAVLVFATNNVTAQKTPADTMTLKLENAKMAPVTFSHGAHGKTNKCSLCHHKDKDPTGPEKCGTCHLLKEVKDKAIPATDAFHKQCQTCHKEAKSKGVGAPTNCNECHKK
jgi:hypothetical protein